MINDGREWKFNCSLKDSINEGIILEGFLFFLIQWIINGDGQNFWHVATCEG